MHIDEAVCGFKIIRGPSKPPSSNSYPLVLIERDFIVAPVVELSRTGRGVIGHLLSMLKRAAIFQVIGDARSPQTMISDFCLDACLPGAALNHAVGVGLGHAVWRAGRASRGSKEWPLFLRSDTCRGDVFIEKRFALVMARGFVFLAAFLVEAHPAAPAL